MKSLRDVSFSYQYVAKTVGSAHLHPVMDAMYAVSFGETS